MRTRDINVCYKFSRCLGLPSPPTSPRRPRPGPCWWRERGQLWQQEQSGLDKCERFSAGHLEWSSFPLCQQVEKFLRPYCVLDSGLMAQGDILSWWMSPLCCDVEAGWVCCPDNDYYCTKWDGYYYFKGSVLTSCVYEVHLCTTEEVLQVPQGRLDLYLRMVINLKTISILLKGITVLLLSTYISYFICSPSPQLPSVLCDLIFLKSSKCYSSVEFWGLLNPKDCASWISVNYEIKYGTSCVNWI